MLCYVTECHKTHRTRKNLPSKIYGFFRKFILFMKQSRKRKINTTEFFSFYEQPEAHTTITHWKPGRCSEPVLYSVPKSLGQFQAGTAVLANSGFLRGRTTPPASCTGELHSWVPHTTGQAGSKRTLFCAPHLRRSICWGSPVEGRRSANTTPLHTAGVKQVLQYFQVLHKECQLSSPLQFQHEKTWKSPQRHPQNWII